MQTHMIVQPNQTPQTPNPEPVSTSAAASPQFEVLPPPLDATKPKDKSRTRLGKIALDREQPAQARSRQIPESRPRGVMWLSPTWMRGYVDRLKHDGLNKSV